MIDLSQIRLGNWLHWSYRDNPSETGHNFKWHMRDWYAIGECTLFEENIFPILLSEDILLKCGFILITDWNVKRHDGFSLLLDLGYLMLGVGVMGGDVTLFDNNGCSCGVHIKYLHQLQNLYYSLTGEELKIDNL